MQFSKCLCSRVLKGDVIKIKFVKLWDLSGYSERTTSKRPTCQKLTLWENCLWDISPFLLWSILGDPGAVSRAGEWTGQLKRDNSRRVRTYELRINCSPIGHNNTKHFLCPIRSQHSLDRLEMVRWESVPRGFSACAWKLLSRLFSRPDWPPLGLRGWLWSDYLLHAPLPPQPTRPLKEVPKDHFQSYLLFCLLYFRLLFHDPWQAWEQK